MAPDREHIARSLRTARENRGINQQDAARHLGLSRSLIAQIELGNRPVSPEELSKLAALYRRPVSEFTPAAELREADVLSGLLRVAPWFTGRGAKQHLEDALDLCRQATELEALLGRESLVGVPYYELRSPRNLAEAIAQGERVAAQERQRLGLGPELPIANVSSLVMSQGVRAAAIDLPEEVLGLFVRHPSLGSAALTSGMESASARRLGFLREYAHAVLERGRTTIVTTPLNIDDELTQRRASAFAVAFLLPSAGIEAAVTNLGKGQPSRKAHTVFGHELEKPATAETRSAPGSQTLTYHDVATIARRFGISYRSMTYRLQALAIVSEADGKKLRTPTHQRAARDYARLVTPERETTPARRVKGEHGRELKGYVAHLAIDAYRRRLIDAEELSALASKLSMSGLSAAKLVELAEAAR